MKIRNSFVSVSCVYLVLRVSALRVAAMVKSVGVRDPNVLSEGRAAQNPPGARGVGPVSMLSIFTVA